MTPPTFESLVSNVRCHRQRGEKTAFGPPIRQKDVRV